MMANNSKVLIALLGGAVLGAVLGILLASASGEQTRNKISEAARKAAGKVKDSLKSVVDCNNSFAQEEEVGV